MYGHGSGFGWAKWHFFRIENNRLVTGLKVVSGATHSIIGLPLGHEVNTKVHIKDVNHIEVLYHYAFHFGASAHTYLEESYYHQHERTLTEVPLIKGQIKIAYVWNPTNQQYQLADGNLKAKEKFLNNYGQFSEFYNAFRSEIEESTHPNKDQILRTFQKIMAKEPETSEEPLFLFGYLSPSYYQARNKK